MESGSAQKIRAQRQYAFLLRSSYKSLQLIISFKLSLQQDWMSSWTAMHTVEWRLKEAAAMYYSRPDRCLREDIDEWKRALQQICSCSGWFMDIPEGFEAGLVKMVVNDLIKALDRVPLSVTKHPVGMDSPKNALIQKLNLNSMDEEVKVGIWVLAVSARLQSPRLHTTAADPTGLTNLQKQILDYLSKYDSTIHSVDKGISLFRERLGGKRVLLILDDVDAVEQLNALVGDWLASCSSRVIITSRDKHILNVAHVSYECIHEMSGLEINEGLQLFNWHTFLNASQSPSYKDLSTRIVEACQGHPLSLEVIGFSMYDKQNDPGCWTGVLCNTILKGDICRNLYISYGAFSDEGHKLFMNITCFFVREKKTCTIIFWKSLYKMVNTAVYNLSMKLLIKIDDKGVLLKEKKSVLGYGRLLI
ncbi:hypothetical protein SUGI_0556000 [Cryptomeria japonica]|nr:hypothetical protein SUGI_0556000 [Cryptomeria japonica]